ncbi:tripartite tricarboxylate transporter TctB family protein [Roseomonas sp. M0104]|uniref:Tripartite tricarboxylate transporter TctB family protein n=1 Tax=Teichococcus coralli TaxID=2545983 RepID=A0A845BGP2_9PROT|nr:tripartite tricarboxylate transporter TctB family protein [Pseudoroseomonas coralli]MXP62649.1 tripartite tricarboxylate transporter TctB family protein [Pseudoroseomonas coralli]
MRMLPDRACAAAMAAVAVLAFAATYGFDEVPPGLAQGLGAAEFPRLVCLVLLGLAALLFLGAAPRNPPPRVPATGWATMALAVGFLPLMMVVGMLPAMLVFLVAMGWLWGERRWGVLLGSAIGLVAGIWIVFVRLFALSLPGGWLGERLFS